MNEHRNGFSIHAMCDVFRVSRSGFYAWLIRPKSKRQIDDERLLPLIRPNFEKGLHVYDYRRIHDDLRSHCGKHRVARLMRDHHIQPKFRRRFKVTMDSKHDKPVFDNILNRQFNAEKPNQRWTSDMTYIHTNEGWLYLAVIMDLYSKKIVGWSMSHRMKDDLIKDALMMALLNREISHGLLLHSDRGCQYASEQYQKMLSDHGITRSMDRRTNCWDNSAMESFFRSLKTECVYHKIYLTCDDARRSVFDYSGVL
jgi:putative transposase